MDSPFQQHFGTNYTPTQEEEGKIRNLVASYRQEVRDIDGEIERLHKQIESLNERRDVVDEFADKHQELISPVRMLTQDILECIFLFCIPEENIPAISAYDLPMLLTHVCSSWRRIASSTPRLWTAIYITLPVMHIEPFAIPGTLEKEEARSHRVLTSWQLAVNKWLDLSGACPLTVSVRQETFPNVWHIGDDVEGYNSAMDRIRKAQLLMIKNIILSCHQRLYSLDLCVSDNIVRILVEAGVKNELCLQMLKHIHITRQRDSYSPMERIPFHFKDIWTIIPSETASVTLYDIQISYTNDSIPKKQCWMLLTELNLSFPNLGDVNQFDVTLAILRHCPELITAKLKILDSQSENPVGDRHATTIVLPHLTNFSVSLSPTPTALSFANQLYIPSLKELNIQFTTYGWISKPEEILKSLVRVADDFHTLILFEPEWIKSADDLIQALEVVPSVKRLKIIVEPVQHNRWDVQRSFSSSETRVQHALSDGLLHALNPMQKDYSDIICPRLEEFECNNKWLTVFSESVLKDFLISRRDDPRVVPIRRLVVTINNYKLLVDSDSSEKISLGDDSSVFFRRKDTDGCRYRWYDYELFSDMYKEL